MALAAAVRQIEAEGFATLTSYGAFLAAEPPAWEVQIRQATSWSCAHGVSAGKPTAAVAPDPTGISAGGLRCARRSTGCASRSTASTRRGPRPISKSRGKPATPTSSSSSIAAPSGSRAWLARHQRVPLDGAAQVETRRLLEMQRNRLLMYTSCGWFFDEISGLEPVQILKYAAMAIQYLRDLGGGQLEPEFVRRLEAAPTTSPSITTAARSTGVWSGPPWSICVGWSRTTPSAGSSTSSPTTRACTPGACSGWTRPARPMRGTTLRLGRVRVGSEVTGETPRS